MSSASPTATAVHPSVHPARRRRLPAWVGCVLAVLLFLPAASASVLPRLIPGFSGLLERQNGVMVLAMALGAGITLLAYLLLAWALVRFIDRRPCAALGLRPSGRALAALAVGMLVSAAVVLGVLTLMSARGWGRPMEGDTSLTTAPWWMVIAVVLIQAFVLQGIGEEVVFRGYVLQTARSRARWAPLISAVLFAIPHLASSGGQQNLWEHLAYLAIPFGFGLAAGYLCVVLRSAWAGIGIHGGFHVATAVAVALGVFREGPTAWLLFGAVYVVIALVVARTVRAERWREVAEHGPYGI